MVVGTEQLELERSAWTADGTGLSGGADDPGPCVITVGNQKGGTGKSTITVHLAAALLKFGYSVGTFDLDGGQGTLSRYLSNREAFVDKSGQNIPMPRHRRLRPSKVDNRADAQAEEQAAFAAAVDAMAGVDFLVIDTAPGDSFLSHLGHLAADTLITPINDSFLDLDVLAEIDVEGREVLRPSSYSRMVMGTDDLREKKGRPPVDWIVVRNRLTHIDARNKREVQVLLMQLAQRFGFAFASGFGERVIFRELFRKGLTLMDLPEEPAGKRSTSSIRTAHDEMRTLLRAIGIVQMAGSG